MELKETIRERYAEAARAASAGSGCSGPSCCEENGCSAEAGARNVEFLKGEIEAIPLPADSVDVVISNCVVNLSPDKPAVLREIFRVLRPGGRVGISDVVAEDRLTPDERAERGSYVGCIAGALAKGEYERELAAAGFEE